MQNQDQSQSQSQNFTDGLSELLRQIVAVPLCWRHTPAGRVATEADLLWLAARGLIVRVARGEPFSFRGLTIRADSDDYVPTRSGWRLVDSVD